TGVIDNDAGSLVEFATVCGCVGVRADQSLFLAGKENEANAATGLEARGFNGAQGVDDEGGVASVVEGAGAQVPRIEMSAHNHELAGLVAAFDLRNHVR